MPPDPPRFGMLRMPDCVLHTQLSCSLQCICAPPFCESWIRPWCQPKGCQMYLYTPCLKFYSQYLSKLKIKLLYKGGGKLGSKKTSTSVPSLTTELCFVDDPYERILLKILGRNYSGHHGVRTECGLTISFSKAKFMRVVEIGIVETDVAPSCTC